MSYEDYIYEQIIEKLMKERGIDGDDVELPLDILIEASAMYLAYRKIIIGEDPVVKLSEVVEENERYFNVEIDYEGVTQEELEELEETFEYVGEIDFGFINTE